MEPMSESRKLTGREVQALCEAMLDAFPKRHDLAYVVRVHLDVTLDEVSAKGALAADVFELLSWVQARDRVGDLIRGARAENPENRRLQAVARVLGHMEAPARDAPGPRAPKVSISTLPTTTEQFVGRVAELAQLTAAWEDAATHIATIVAWGGSGKTTLVTAWLAGMAGAGWGGAARVFVWSFYSQGTHRARAASADAFVSAALSFFEDPDPTGGSAWERGARLAALARAQRTLLILDGLEPLQEPEGAGGRLRDPAMDALLRGLAMSGNGLCLITTRQPLAELRPFVGRTVTRVDLDQLEEVASVELLRRFGVEGADEEFHEVARAVEGHALTLTLLGNYIADALDRDVRRWREVPLGVAETDPGRRAFRVLEAYDRWLGSGPECAILRLLGLFDRPADARCLAALRQQPAIAGVTDTLVDLSKGNWNLRIAQLRRMGLLAPAARPDDGSLDAHPLVRECFARILEEESPEGFRAAHGRIFERLQNIIPESPLTLAELDPFFQAMWHGCKAGRHTEALGGFKRYDKVAARQFGAYGALLATLANFFARDWGQPIDGLSDANGTWLLNQVAFCLRALGRLREATEVMQATLAKSEAKGDWPNAIVDRDNLTSLYLSRGDLERARAMAERGVEEADSTEPGFQRVSNRSTCARIYHLLGHLERARSLFAEAEYIQLERQPSAPGLYGLRGYWLCDLLLDLGEVEEARRRASEALLWTSLSGYPAEAGYHRLTLGRTLVASGQYEEARGHFDTATEALRGVGMMEYFAPSLVNRAEFHRAAGDREAASRDLADALDRAKRYELRIVECDAYVEQTRLALDAQDLGAACTALDGARAVAADCQYRRRDAVLALLGARLDSAGGEPSKV